ncbi:DUF625-domain-containing protein, partial [Atractiella rhizophila]
MPLAGSVCATLGHSEDCDAQPRPEGFWEQKVNLAWVSGGERGDGVPGVAQFVEAAKCARRKKGEDEKEQLLTSVATGDPAGDQVPGARQPIFTTATAVMASSSPPVPAHSPTHATHAATHSPSNAAGPTNARRTNEHGEKKKVFDLHDLVKRGSGLSPAKKGVGVGLEGGLGLELGVGGTGKGEGEKEETTSPFNTPPRLVGAGVGDTSTTPSPSPPRVAMGIPFNGDDAAFELHDYLALDPSVEAGADEEAKIQQRKEKRVKVYSLAKAVWDDLGTGFCEGRYRMSPEPGERERKENESTSPPSSPPLFPAPPTLAAQVLVRAEENQESLLLESEIEPWLPEWGAMDEVPLSLSEEEKKGGTDRIGRYSRQQDTLIVWNDTNLGVDMALSFATAKGCEEMWEFFLTAQKQVALSLEAAGDWGEDDDLISYSNPSSPLTFGSLFPSFGTSMNGTLPPPSLGNIKEAEQIVRHCAKSLLWREKLSGWIVSSGYLKKLVEIFVEAEELESNEDLNSICELMQAILLLHDTAIFEFIIADSLYLPIFGMLEYSPSHPTQKANYRHHLSTPNLFQQIEGLPITDEKTLIKIHHTFRLQYLRDVILGRVGDEPVMGVLGSLLFFNQCDIVGHLMNNKPFLTELFGMFQDAAYPEGEAETKATPTSPDSKSEPEIGPHPPPSPQKPPSSRSRRLQAMLFLQQLSGLAKTMQVSQRSNMYRNLIELGLLRVIEYGLAADKQDKERAVGLELLMIVIDHDPSKIRAYTLQQNAGRKKTLVLKMIETVLEERDWGTQLQMMEGLRVLVDASGEFADAGTGGGPNRIRLEDPVAEQFLHYFYEHCAKVLLAPIGDLEVSKESIPQIPLANVNLIGQLCDLLCFFIFSHGFRSKYLVLSGTGKLLEQIVSLLRTPYKHLRLAGIRVLRAVVQKQDDFYNRSLIRSDVFGTLLSLVEMEVSSFGLTLSACLELFELIKSSTQKVIINHLFDVYKERMKALGNKLKTFAALDIKWEQMNDSAMRLSSSVSSAPDTSTPKREISIGAWGPGRRIDADEESYFNDDDDDEGTLNISVINRSGQTSATGSKKRVLEDADDGEEEGRKKPRLIVARTSPANPNGVPKSQSWPLPGSPAKGLVDYDDEDEDTAGGFVRESLSSEKDTIQPPSSETVPSAVANEASRAPSPPPPLLKPGEKRRREEEEEEEASAFGNLAKKRSIVGLNDKPANPSPKLKTPSPAPSDTSTPPGNGKIKFNLGQKSQIPIRRSVSTPPPGGLVLKLKNSAIRKANDDSDSSPSN